MWILWIAILLLLIRAYNKLSCGRCYAKTVLTGEVAIVTGANSGIGYETALTLARRGAKVILACRDDQRGLQAENSIKKVTKNKFVRYMKLDLSSFESIRSFVDEFKKTEAKLDLLINNAGASGMGRSKTADGVVKDMQVNHFGPFLLTILLVPILKKSAPSRVINVTSFLHKFGHADKVNDENSNYINIYCNSQLCNVLFSNELARRLENSGVVVNSADPGLVNTSLFKSTSLDTIRSLVLYPFFKSPEEGAQTTLYLAMSEDCDQISGKYYSDCSESTMSSKAEDAKLARKLWSLSEDIVKLRRDERIIKM